MGTLESLGKIVSPDSLLDSSSYRECFVILSVTKIRYNRFDRFDWPEAGPSQLAFSGEADLPPSGGFKVICSPSGFDRLSLGGLGRRKLGKTIRIGSAGG